MARLVYKSEGSAGPPARFEAQPEPEPWCMKMNGCKTKCEDCPDESPQRTWVGLTNEDCEEVERWVEFKEEGSGRIPMGKLARYIEAKLKEKNT